MRAYISIIGGKVLVESYTSLSLICKNVGVSYNSAVRGKRVWVLDGVILEIKEIDVIKIKGRGKF
jgi:hypothetical protein